MGAIDNQVGDLLAFMCSHKAPGLKTPGSCSASWENDLDFSPRPTYMHGATKFAKPWRAGASSTVRYGYEGFWWTHARPSCVDNVSIADLYSSAARTLATPMSHSRTSRLSLPAKLFPLGLPTETRESAPVTVPQVWGSAVTQQGSSMLVCVYARAEDQILPTCEFLKLSIPADLLSW